MKIDIKWIGSSVLGLLAIIIIVALTGYIATSNETLMNFVYTAFILVVIGVIVVTLIINAPRFK